MSFDLLFCLKGTRSRWLSLLFLNRVPPKNLIFINIYPPTDPPYTYPSQASIFETSPHPSVVFNYRHFSMPARSLFQHFPDVFAFTSFQISIYGIFVMRP